MSIPEPPKQAINQTNQAACKTKNLALEFTETTRIETEAYPAG
jgi:hypothetical protein